MKVGTHKTGTYNVKLMLYRGKKTYNEHGKVSSDHQEMDAPMYPSLEWDKYVDNINQLYTGADVLSVKEIIKTVKQNPDLPKGEVLVTVTLEDEVSKEVIDKVSGQIKSTFAAPEKELTPQEQRIADLEAKLEALVSGTKVEVVKAAPKIDNTPIDDDVDDIPALRMKYITLTGSEPDKRWKEKKLNEEIAKAKASKDK